MFKIHAGESDTTCMRINGMAVLRRIVRCEASFLRYLAGFHAGRNGAAAAAAAAAAAGNGGLSCSFKVLHGA